MNISEYLGAGVKGHQNFDFVDVDLDSDTKLFIDPSLIELGQDEWCQECNEIITSYFNCLYENFRRGFATYPDLLDHASEQNATKLGYGNGFNGKGKTPEGLYDSLCGLHHLVDSIPTIDKPQDLTIFVEGFAEDCMSDLLTNLLHGKLNDFTAQQMLIYGIQPQGQKMIWIFNPNQRIWERVYRPCWLHKGKEILLVPKKIVRHRFLFSTHQYLYSIILDRIREENGWYDLTKHDIWQNLVKCGIHWEYEHVRNYSIEHPDALLEYHQKQPRYYLRKYATLSDNKLDSLVYGTSLQ